MTRPTQKNEEIELAQIFLSAYYSDYSTQINFERCDDNKFEKLDVIATDNSKPKENTFLIAKNATQPAREPTQPPDSCFFV